MSWELNWKTSSNWRRAGGNELGIRIQFKLEFEGAWGNELGIQISFEVTHAGDWGI